MASDSGWSTERTPIFIHPFLIKTNFSRSSTKPSEVQVIVMFTWKLKLVIFDCQQCLKQKVIKKNLEEFTKKQENNKTKGKRHN